MEPGKPENLSSANGTVNGHARSIAATTKQQPKAKAGPRFCGLRTVTTTTDIPASLPPPSSLPPPPPAARRGFNFAKTVASSRDRARARRNRQTPQPWAVRKLMVPLTSAIMVYTAYVFCGRLAPRIGRAKGIGLGLGFAVLWLWMVWAYVKVVITPPGNARDYVSQSPQPLFPIQPTPMSPNTPPQNRATDNAATYDTDDESDLDDAALAELEAGRIGGPAYNTMQSPIQIPIPIANSGPPTSETAAVDAAPPPGKIPARTPRGRHPPTTPVLLPQHRWCGKCQIVKPYRAHHCRVCGTCILKYDHHCPWIGQCVGARNHKFFLNFCVAAGCLTAYTFGSLLAFNVGESGVDAQELVIIVLSALFLLFTSSLSVAHGRLISHAQTTVESIKVRTLREKEAAQLGVDGWQCWEVGAKQRVKRSYDAEWGNPDTEGNIWWPGSRRGAWEDVMGHAWLGWILPVGRPLGDGLDYKPNPRFDEQGRWRRRSEWPGGLRGG
ncbi:unnamed protein product [Mycena citricolor]|uniref:Palmitoyltransferase n=1 Tax=Mycena citricolor TaxID=2018698 RepID=A0AAD2H967_9AGAR|nr:unnamed protein product [Mycena citricolor]